MVCTVLGLCWLTSSLSARRAWIEITVVGRTWEEFEVALRKESVDRNVCLCLKMCSQPVALRKESVDRNAVYNPRLRAGNVALRKESVDRNVKSLALLILHSLVALRKESVDRNMMWMKRAIIWAAVALRKESVDRNVKSN